MPFSEAAGNEDFVNAEFWDKIVNKEEIESWEYEDLVALGLCVYLLIGDTKDNTWNSCMVKSKWMEKEGII